MKDTGFDLIIMLDSAVTPSQFEILKSFARRFMQEVDVDGGDWRIGVMTFDNRPRTYFNLNR